MFDNLIKFKSLKDIGLKFTTVYFLLILLFIPIGVLQGWIEIRPILLNEIGDLLAGLFGPLAIFWIVLGFLQQGEELKNSVNTLKLQAKELAHSVEQQKSMVEVTRETLEHEKLMLGKNIEMNKKKLQPHFVVNLRATSRTGPSIYKFAFKLTNSTSSCSDISLFLYLNSEIVISNKTDFLGTGQIIERKGFEFSNSELPTERLSLIVTFKDQEGDSFCNEYELIPPSEDRWGEVFGCKTVLLGIEDDGEYGDEELGE